MNEFQLIHITEYISTTYKCSTMPLNLKQNINERKCFKNTIKEYRIQLLHFSIDTLDCIQNKYLGFRNTNDKMLPGCER